jgi:hypothetical protein
LLPPAMCWGANFWLAAGSWTWQLIGSWFCSDEVMRSSHLEGGAIGSILTPVCSLKTGTLSETVWKHLEPHFSHFLVYQPRCYWVRLF